MISRGEIYLANLAPAGAHEPADPRPVLIVQNDIGNQYSSATIVAGITVLITKRRLPTHVEVSARESGLAKDGVILLEQLLTVAKERLVRHVGSLSAERMAEVNRALGKSLQLD